jgi:glycosyltransferase involved in cell wall biosynthesis
VIDRLRGSLTRARSSPQLRAAWARAHLATLALLRWAGWRPPRPWRRFPHTGPVTLLIHNAYGMGGTIRSTISEANQLARDGRRVRLVSVSRGLTQHTPFFPVDDGVELVLLDDPIHPSGSPLRRVLRRVPSLLVHPEESRFPALSLWHDLLLWRAVRAVREGSVVGTRAALNVVVATGCRPGVVRIGQEHVPYGSYPPTLTRDITGAYRRLDALLVLTSAEAEVARGLLGDAPTCVAVVPNPLPDTPHRVSDGRAPVVVTAGRFSRQKRHNLLIDAFARLVDEFPGWQLWIYGRGPREWRLHEQLDRLDLGDRIQLRGASDRLGEDLAEASVFALSSDQEAFGIVLIEAMRSGLAVVSTACEHGPPEILTHEVDGLLVPVNDEAALADGLRRVMADADLRARLATNARRRSRDYEPDVVGQLTADAYAAAAQVRAAREAWAQRCAPRPPRR